MGGPRGVDERMTRQIRKFAFTVVVTAIVGAVAVFALSDGMLEGILTGALFGGCVGFIVAMWHAQNKGVSYEYEAAGLPDDNLTTIARRDLARPELRERDLNPGP